MYFTKVILTSSKNKKAETSFNDFENYFELNSELYKTFNIFTEFNMF